MPAAQVSPQLGAQSQPQVSRFGTKAAGHARAAAEQAQEQLRGSKSKPGAQVAFSTHSQAQVVVLQVVKPPQEALQSAAHSGSQVVVLHWCWGVGRPPQSAAHS